VLDHGRVVAAGTPAAIAAGHGGGTCVRFSADGRDVAWLKEVEGVRELRQHGARVEVTGEGPVLALVAAALVGHGLVPDDLHAEQPTLEDAFLKLTGEQE
jgi:ABC-2 type transport system ATP-binding protein